jgi:hypothetical protein
MNPRHPLTPSLSPSKGERVPVGRVRGFTGTMRELVRGKSLPIRWGEGRGEGQFGLQIRILNV